MAQAIACDLCGTEAAVLLQTSIDTGQVIAVGAACLFPFYLGGANGIAETMNPDIKAAYVRDVLILREQFADELDALFNAAAQAGTDTAEPGPDEPEIPDYDPGPEVDDQGGMSEIHPMEPAP